MSSNNLVVSGEMYTPTLQSMVDFQKMVFVFNMVNDGWTVRLLDDKRYEFRKADHNITSDQCLDGFLSEFIQYYLKLKDSMKEGSGE